MSDSDDEQTAAAADLEEFGDELDESDGDSIEMAGARPRP
jgi:hypothetical protein